MALQDLINLLNLETIEENWFRGQSPQEERQRVFGGQVIGQALMAALRTVTDERPVHSLHAYFLRPGDMKVPILYEVDRIRDGRSFTTRRVKAVQHGKAIFSMSASFHKRETGYEHQSPMPDVPPPEELPGPAERFKRLAEADPKRYARRMTRAQLVEFRLAPLQRTETKGRYQPKSCSWLKANGELPDDLAIHQCVLAYASDETLLNNAQLPYRDLYDRESFQTASIDHAMWFHHSFRADEWLLYEQDSPCSVHNRGFTRGNIYTREGKLIASVAQEGLLRKVR
ncbi:MAG: acyl-CoA thioesterase II [Pseudomonadota bacterium]